MKIGQADYGGRLYPAAVPDIFDIQLFILHSSTATKFPPEPQSPGPPTRDASRRTQTAVSYENW